MESLGSTVVHQRKLSGRKERTAGLNASAGADTPVASLRLQLVCVAATMTAAVIFTLTEHDDHRHTWWCVFEICMQALLVIVGTAYFRMRSRLLPDSSLLLPPLLMVTCFSMLCEPIQRLVFKEGHSFEILVMHSQCNLMLALAVCGFRMAFQRLAMLIAVFLTIFSCSISNAVGLVPATICFVLACLSWLVCSWWESVERRRAKTEHRSRPLFWMSIGLAAVALLLIPSLGFGNNTVTAALRGFMPSSGGTGSYDPYARGGVNDGDALVAGTNDIRSFAPLEDAPFVESEQPSLYDVLNDEFDAPVKRTKEFQRAVSLPPEMMNHIHRQMAEAKQAGREFSLIRDEHEASRSQLRDLDTTATFYVAGPVPAHFRMEVYEHFDGVTWYPLPDASELTFDASSMKMKEVEGHHWLQIPQSSRVFEIYDGSATHSLKIANLDNNIIPSPPHLIGVNIPDVHHVNMYGICARGIPSVRRESVPTMTPINVVSEYAVRDRLEKSRVKMHVTPKPSGPNALPDIHLVLPSTIATDRVRQLAKDWTKGLPRGWQQIQAIESRLREQYTLDRTVRISADSESPVTEFLLERRRGPEYLFATSAACLLRSLDYPARLVSGFYADPKNYDPRKQHTSVFAENAHFWCEVGLGINTWITIEPSPGYEIAKPPPGLLAKLWQSVLRSIGIIRQHAVAFVMLLAGLLVVFRLRYFLLDLGLTLGWKLSSRESPAVRALKLGILIEKRLRFAHLHRHAGTTLRRWAHQGVFDTVRGELVRVADVADSAMFGGCSADSRHDELDRLAAALSYWRLRQIRRESLTAEKAV